MAALSSLGSARYLLVWDVIDQLQFDQLQETNLEPEARLAPRFNEEHWGKVSVRTIGGTLTHFAKPDFMLNASCFRQFSTFYREVFSIAKKLTAQHHGKEALKLLRTKGVTGFPKELSGGAEELVNSWMRQTLLHDRHVHPLPSEVPDLPSECALEPFGRGARNKSRIPAQVQGDS